MDPRALAAALLRDAQGADRPASWVIEAEQWRARSRRRRRVAVLVAPLAVLLGAGALARSLDLAGVALICGFGFYAALTIAAQETAALDTAATQVVTWAGGRLWMTDLPGVTVAAAIDRGDHVRLILGNGPDVGSRDLPLDPAQRAAFLDALRAAGVPVRVTRRPCKIPRGGA